MTSIGLISDVHASPGPVEEALSIFDDRGVELVYCAGDIAGYNDQLEETIALLKQSKCCCILGNHDLLYLDHHGDEEDNTEVKFLKQLPSVIEVVIEGTRLYMVHAQPPDECNGGIKLLDKNGKLMQERIREWEEKLKMFYCDVLIIGHTHQVFAETIGRTLVVNPGSSVFNHSCAILNLPEKTVEMIPLSGGEIRTTWNWGQHVIHGD